MTDPLGLIGNSGALHRGAHSLAKPHGAHSDPGAPSFNDLLKQQLADVNALQQDAKRAVEDLAAGRRTDLESVIIATEKADVAFKMLLQVRNKVMDAYEEVKQIRV
jgi:flagellar hook-basal body complex protein FliE